MSDPATKAERLREAIQAALRARERAQRALDEWRYASILAYDIEREPDP